MDSGLTAALEQEEKGYAVDLVPQVGAQNGQNVFYRGTLLYILPAKLRILTAVYMFYPALSCRGIY